MAYTAPPTFSDTNVLYASQLNTYLRDNMAWIESDRPRCALTLNGGAYTHALANSGKWMNPAWSSTEPVDTGSMHSGTNAYVTVPSGAGGFWMFGASATWDGNTAGSRGIALTTSAATGGGALAGTLLAKVQESAINNGPSLVVSGATYLAASTTIYANVWQNSGSASDRIVSEGFFWAVRMCA